VTVRSAGFQPLVAALRAAGTGAPPTPGAGSFGAALDEAGASEVVVGSLAGPAGAGALPSPAASSAGPRAEASGPGSGAASVGTPAAGGAASPGALGAPSVPQAPRNREGVASGAPLSGLAALPVSSDAWVAALGAPSVPRAMGAAAPLARGLTAVALAPRSAEPPVAPASPLVAGAAQALGPSPLLEPGQVAEAAPVVVPTEAPAALVAAVAASSAPALQSGSAPEPAPARPGAFRPLSAAALAPPAAGAPGAALPTLAARRLVDALHQRSQQAAAEAVDAWLDTGGRALDGDAGGTTEGPAAPPERASLPPAVAGAPVLRAPLSTPAGDVTRADAAFASPVGPSAGHSAAPGGASVSAAAPQPLLPEEPFVLHAPSAERLEVDLREGDLTLRFTVARGEDDSLHVDLHAPRSVIEAMGDIQSDLDSSFADEDLDLGAFTAHADDDAEDASGEDGSPSDGASDEGNPQPGAAGREGLVSRSVAPEGTARLIDRLV